MNKEQLVRLPIVAQNIILTKRPTNKQQEMLLAVWGILQDGEWHTSKEISDRVNRSHKYLENIMPSLKEAWGLASGREGYLLPSKYPIIV